MKLTKLLDSVDDIRLLTESKGELGAALCDFAKLVGGRVRWALGGGLAVGFHSRPRGTQDIDVFVRSEDDVDSIGLLCVGEYFARNRKYAVVHSKTGVEIEVLSPEFLRIDPEITRRAVETSEVHDGIPVISKEGLIVLKLQRAEYRDLGDIEGILQRHGEIDLSGFNLSDEQIKIYRQLKRVKDIGERN